MARMQKHVRIILAANIQRFKEKKFPGRGGSKRCADALGVTPQQWSPWEIGSRGPDEKTLKAIAKMFGVTVEDLLREPESEAKPAAPAPFAASRDATGQVNGSAELVEIMKTLLQAQNDFAAGKRSGEQFSGMMREVLKYTKYVMGGSAG